VFATAAELRRGFGSGTVRTVMGDDVTVSPDTTVAFDVVDPDVATVTGSFLGPVADGPAWLAAMAAAGITATGTPVTDRDSIKVEVHMADAVAAVTARLDAAKLYAARVEPVTRHYETTWKVLAASLPGSLASGSGTTIPNDRVDLAGIYVTHSVPADAYVVITGDEPGDYGYAWPITIALGVFAALFAWGCVVAVRRDWLSSVSVSAAPPR
jgi:hypothetical protein